MTTASLDLSKMEPLLPDDRVEMVANIMRAEVGVSRLADAQFVTFIQPAQEVKKDGLIRNVAAMAVFGVISPHPKLQGQRLMNHGTASLKDFQEAEYEHGHFAGAPDPAYTIFKAVVGNHLTTLQNLSELI